MYAHEASYAHEGAGARNDTQYPSNLKSNGGACWRPHVAAMPKICAEYRCDAAIGKGQNIGANVAAALAEAIELLKSVALAPLGRATATSNAHEFI